MKKVERSNIFSSLNVSARCRELRVSLWQCPHFLFIVMGGIIASSIVITHFVATRYIEPEGVVIIVVLVAVALFIVSHVIVAAFERMAAAYHLKSEFIRIISHEMRTPLSSIKWQLNLLASTLAPALGEFQKAFGVVAEENENMITLVNSLLDIDRIENKAFPLSVAVFSLGALLDEVVEEFRATSLTKERKIEVLRPKEEVMVNADRSQVKNVFRRLIDNAIRYSSVSGEITVALENFGTEAKVSVSDQGKGIPAEEISQVFSKFFRSTNLKYQTSGLGLGLFISRYVIEMSGGKIGFTSIEGKGSTFYFTIPGRAT